MNRRQSVISFLSLVGFAVLQACSNVAPTSSKSMVPLTAKVDGEKFALNLPELPGMAVIGSQAKLKIVSGHVKFAAKPATCPGGAPANTTGSVINNQMGLDKDSLSNVVAELTAPFKAGQLLGPISLKPGDFSLNLEIFERGTLAYFGAATFTVEPGIIKSLDLTLEKQAACPTINDGGVIVNPNLPDGGITINPVIPSNKKSACEVVASVTNECDSTSTFCEWKNPEGNNEVTRGRGSCNTSLARKDLINQLCEQKIMVSEKFLDEIYCSGVPIEPPPPVEETNKVSPFNGTVTATVRGEAVFSQDLTGFKEAATITILGLSGDKVVWSNSVNATIIETILDGKGDFEDKGHHIDFGLNSNLPDIPNSENEDLSISCGTNQDQLNDPNVVLFEQAFTSLPIKISGSQMGVTFAVTNQARLKVSTTPILSTQSLSFTTLESSGASGFMGYVLGIFGPSMTAKQSADSSSSTTFELVSQKELQSIAAGGNKQFDGLVCGAVGSRTITTGQISGTSKVQFSPAVVTGVSPLATMDRLRKEFGAGRTFDFNASLVDDRNGSGSAPIQGVTTIREVSPNFECQGVTNTADIAYEVINEIPGGAHKVGLPKRQLFYINANSKKFAAVITEEDRIDPVLKAPLPPICLISDELKFPKEPDSQPSPDPQITDDDGVLKRELVEKQELVEVAFQVDRLGDSSKYQNCLFAQLLPDQKVFQVGCNRIAPGAAPIRTEVIKINLFTNTCNVLRVSLKTNSGGGLQDRVSSVQPGRVSFGPSMIGKPIAGMAFLKDSEGSYILHANDNNDTRWTDLLLKMKPLNPRPDVKFTIENTDMPCE